jgi:hypothetical protein
MVRIATQGLADPAGAITQEFAANAAADAPDASAMAAESFALARAEVYGEAQPAIPTIDHFVDVRPSQCSLQAPPEIRALKVNAELSFDNDETRQLVRKRLFLGGARLAATLNAIL